MKRPIAGLFTALLLPVAALAQPITTLTGCPAERAVYTMTTEGNNYVVHLIPAQTRAGWSSDLYLRLTTSQRDYWFVFAAASQNCAKHFPSIRLPVKVLVKCIFNNTIPPFRD